ncbi:MAG: hypothetical protein KF861_13015, partial [Planctomycetaceae bacterium]|nr:hypothetical protein [Planctomycetaceae bacterium]
HRPTGEHALLLFVLMNTDGEPLHDPTTSAAWMKVAKRAVDRIKRPFSLHRPELSPDLGVTTQLQILVASADGPLPTEIQEDVRNRFAELQSYVGGMLADDAAKISSGVER